MFRLLYPANGSAGPTDRIVFSPHNSDFIKRQYTMKSYLYYLPLLFGLTACGPDAVVPAESTPVSEIAAIYPDYRDIVVPPNIAPLNVQITSAGDEFVGCISGNGKEIVAAAGADGKLQFDTTEWRQLLEANKGKDLSVSLYAQRDGQWVAHPSYKITVAEEPIDRYLSYRLIEPSYELYRQLGIYQRDLTNFNEYPIYENNRSFDEDENHCVNCHTYQNFSSDHMLMHVRAIHGGTVFIENGKAEKRNMKCDSILSNTVYPSWHPHRNWVVFSTNRTGQAFHMIDKQKVEVIDYGSDLVFYDVDKHELTNILKTTDDMETFPTWAPDGKKVYFCKAFFKGFSTTPDSIHSDLVLARYDSIRYNLMSIPFDEKTKQFGEPVMEFRCDSLGLSATWPRVSPDGRYVLFTLAKFGQFHIWHSSSDLFVKDLQTGEIRPLNAANSDNVDSNHTWSSNGRWIVVSSRRDDGSYSRPYIAYFDKNGQDHKAFLLPQEDPESNLLRLKSYNLPELTKNPVQISQEELTKVIHNDKDIRKVGYSSQIK